ncbi:cobalamin (vitamin B12) biosynthesis CbiM protein [Methanosalsum zhilinae DSM 4017]|uniref:Cobalamin (Vitamin B12) biosynthesis CbiM protein n=1 Tax=Methanosalsum zhilinae (strain DSM 4017 / NBRC 107636 / OCM 62 / WeN5) TaxID=679901 RepID=F7XNE5_METZD|nr:cobalt transporter CbiM [Methanosalsum zhilinae]AEH61195.1 cobalamin (vitamin B12) biosynthesis CbiM protein [Methanosalsum zhilinae DSM 4017]
MHISDGVLSAPIIAAGWAITIVFLLLIFRLKMSNANIAEEIPKFSIMTAAFFVVSLIHLPLGPTSAHPMLNGLMGIVLGPIAYISMFIGLILQAFIFQHGGITTLGINAALLGIPSIIVYYIFKRGYKDGVSVKILGLVCGGLAIGLSALFTVMVLILMGSEFFGLAKVTVVAHLPLILIEGILTGSVVLYIAKVKPELLSIKL